jgi:LL-diaminopimelate aminotransferase
MARINDHFEKLPAGYLFPEIGRRVRAYAAAHPTAKVIRLGIGDVTEPLAPAITAAMHAAVDEMGARETFRGYGPEQGYDFLLDAIRQHDYATRGVTIGADEIFVSDGSKCDSGNLQELFAATARVAVTDPVYPVYVDSNVMAGRTGALGEDGRFRGLTYLAGARRRRLRAGAAARRRGGWSSPTCARPTTPTGTVATRAQLEAWVAWGAPHRRDHRVRRGPTRATSATTRCRTRSSRSRARAGARSSCAASPSAPASPACGARSW